MSGSDDGTIAQQEVVEGGGGTSVDQEAGHDETTQDDTTVDQGTSGSQKRSRPKKSKSKKRKGKPKKKGNQATRPAHRPS